MSESREVEKQLRGKFLKALHGNPCGDVVDDLIGILKEDYILLARESCSCRDCIHYRDLQHCIPSNHCDKYNCYLNNLHRAYNCDDYFSGAGEARKSIARFHNELTGEWIVR